MSTKPVGSAPRTLFEKIWDDHAILQDESGMTLLYAARHLTHDGSHNGFTMLDQRALPVHRPQQLFAVADHGAPTISHRMEDIHDPDQLRVMKKLDENAARHGFTAFNLADPRQGILHVVGPEQGWTQPGMLLVALDSHTATHGALGCLAFGIGASEVCHVLATQTLWQRKPKTMRIVVDGDLPFGVSAKDVILHIIATIGADGAAGHVIEYAGSTISAMSIEQRLTVCNMSIEAGSKAGMIAPDATTFAWLRGRPYAPKNEDWDRALAYWTSLPSDNGAQFDREASFDATRLAPMVTWGNSPAQGLPVTARVPSPGDAQDARRQGDMVRTLDYMDLQPGTALMDIALDMVFIGSCTNGRIEDLREAAGVLRGRRVAVPTIISPGSTPVKQQAEAEGLDRIFEAAGVQWRESGCSMCVAMNGDSVPAGQRCAATTNRNFRGRQGLGSRTHLMSPAMAAASAVRGKISDPRDFMREVI